MKIFLVIFCICIAIISWGQQYNIKNLDMSDGLPSPYVNSVEIDQNGYVWFATQNGVAYFEGKTIQTLTIEKEDVSIDAPYIFCDSRNRIWVGTTTNGVYLISEKEIKNFNTKNGLPNDWVNTICEDDDGKIWIGTDLGVVYFDNNQINALSDPENWLDDAVYSISKGKDNSIWISTVKNGLIHYENNQFVRYSNEEIGLEESSIYTINSSEAVIYLGSTGEGLFSFDGNSFSKMNIPEIEFAWVAKTIFNDNKLTIITDKGLIIYESSENYDFITVNNGLVSNDLYSGTYDINNNLWLTSGGYGVSIIRNEDIQSFTTDQGLSSNAISTLYFDEKDFFVGTSGKGINIFEKDKGFNQKIDFPSLINTNVTAIQKIGNQLWVGGENFSEGVLILEKNNEGVWKHIRSLKSVKKTNINTTTSISVNSKNTVFISTYGNGIFIIDDSDTIHLSEFNILPSNDVLDLVPFGDNGALVSIYNQGVFHYYGMQLYSFSEKHQLKETNVETIKVDDVGRIFLGNKTKGLTIVDGDNVKNFTTKDGLLSNSVFSIVFDKDNIVWIGTEKGINKLIFDKNLNLIKIESITETNGLISALVIKNGLQLIDNFLWVATNKGLGKINTTTKSDTRNPSKIVLSDIRLFFEKVDWKTYENITTDIFGIPNELILEYNQNHLTFSFNTLSINTQEYSTKLEGWDNDWSPYSPNSEAVYSNLQPGVYTLKVKSRDNYGIESENILEFSVTITPPFWQTWWFRITVLVFIIGMLYLLFKLRTAALLKRQEELEATVEERTREVVEEKKQVEYQKHLVDEKNQEISDSINYAERIQRAMLANHKLLDEYFNEYFVFFQPKDVVSGDFYWASKLTNGDLAIVNADSTGHGVPGAIMSMLNMNSLKEAVVGKEISEPHDILTYTRKVIKETLMNDGSAEGGKDGMDCSLLCFSKNSPTIKFAAANNPVWVVRTLENNEKEFIEFKPDKMPVGKHDRDHEPFNLQEFEYQKGDVIYTLTDGMPDQFGGPKGKKYMYKKLKTFLSEISELPMEAQKEKIHAEFMDWMQSEEQVDDVCIIGVRV
jgi:ligand-binding sensor domain-containing protein/serine phosphatase RsbU (regulator of sigma subunit)